MNVQRAEINQLTTRDFPRLCFAQRATPFSIPLEISGGESSAHYQAKKRRRLSRRRFPNFSTRTA